MENSGVIKKKLSALIRDGISPRDYSKCIGEVDRVDGALLPHEFLLRFAVPNLPVVLGPEATAAWAAWSRDKA